MKPVVIVTETLDDVPARWLAERAQVIWCPHDQTERLRGELARADGLLVRTYTQVNNALLVQAPRLKVVGRAGVGLDNIDVPACRRHGVEVVYTPDANTQAVIEYVFGLILDTYRPRTAMPDHVDSASFHKMRKEQVGRQLDEMTLGIVGFGRIGKRLGQVAHAVGMRLLVNDLLPENTLRPLVNYPFTYVDKSTLYRDSDIVTIHVDGRPENRHLVNAEALSHLQPAALFLNAARGMLIDHAALATWARAHSAARIILDVHDPEPPPPDYAMYGCHNVKLLPHLASRTHRALENMSWVVKDVIDVLAGIAPQFPAP